MVKREELYALVWSEPMTKVAKRYEVTSSYLARVCSALNVPRPPRGYWAKLAVGRAPQAEGLPEARPADQLTWNEKGGPLQAPRPLSAKREVRRRSGRSAVHLQGHHAIVRGTKAEFLRSRPGVDSGYLKPFKQLLPDIRCSEACLDRALDLASKLYNELEAIGGDVVIGPADRRWHGAQVDEREVPKKDRQRYYEHRAAWSPLRSTVAFLDGTPVTLVVVEMTEEVALRYVDGKYIREAEYQANLRKYQRRYSFETTKELPSTRFRIVAASAEGVDWALSWQERGATTLDASLPRIAKEIRAALPTIRELVGEAERQAEIRRQEWEAAEDRRRRKEDRELVEQSVKDSSKRLAAVIENWTQRTAIAHFFDELSGTIEQLPPTEREEMERRLAIAREFIGTTDPLDFFRSWKTPDEIYAPRFAKGTDEPVRE
jgi:hypothetical protein